MWRIFGNVAIAVEEGCQFEMELRYRRGLLEEGREFIEKPLAPETLARKVREMVDARSAVL
jgi:hypothetical protein